MEATVPEYKKEKSQIDIPITKGISEWEGWGTALKPAHEPIVMARKPIPKTIAENVLEHGVGGINIDECRVETNPEVDDMLKEVERVQRDESNVWSNKNSGFKNENNNLTGVPIKGRYPANVMHDDSEVVQDIFADKARYFYCPKASKKDRDEGLENFVEAQTTDGNIRSNSDTARVFGANSVLRKNTHPTVKPTELMKYLCTLVTPKQGIVLDPFMGSGSTGKAALQKGFRFVGIEMNEEYFEIACSRIESAQKGQGEMF
jgi:site-specific DNA-methyltransferase (adenine-specific)